VQLSCIGATQRSELNQKKNTRQSEKSLTQKAIRLLLDSPFCFNQEEMLDNLGAIYYFKDAEYGTAEQI
jgi:hypothetical protein